MNAYKLQNALILANGFCGVTLETSLIDLIRDGINWDDDEKKWREFLFRNGNFMRIETCLYILSVLD